MLSISMLCRCIQLPIDVPQTTRNTALRKTYKSCHTYVTTAAADATAAAAATAVLITNMLQPCVLC
jgi:hypothetical protein